MHIFISAGEPSGDLHGANLIREIKKVAPDIRLTGFGGARMVAAGCEIVYPLANHSVMGFVQVGKQLLTFMRLLNDAHQFLRAQRPDLLVVIDYPGFHWKLAKRARAEGIPVVYFVPPQIWAWAQWRVKKMRRLITHVLSALPFEHDWLAKRGVATTYIGHPYFDELASYQLSGDFMAAERARPGRIVGILPGSRNQEVKRNIPEMLRAARLLHERLPDTRFLVAAFNEQQAIKARLEAAARQLPLDVHVGRTPEIIALAECCMAVSGSVSLEMMYYRTPAAIVYRVRRIHLKLARRFVKVPFITLVNLLANEEVFPEFVTDRDPSAGVADCLHLLLTDAGRRAHVQSRLAELCALYARPGACASAARFVVDMATRQRPVSSARPE